MAQPDPIEIRAQIAFIRELHDAAQTAQVYIDQQPENEPLAMQRPAIDYAVFDWPEHLKH